VAARRRVRDGEGRLAGGGNGEFARGFRARRRADGTAVRDAEGIKAPRLGAGLSQCEPVEEGERVMTKRFGAAVETNSRWQSGAGREEEKGFTAQHKAYRQRIEH
jgi:hypothetical protein